MEKLHFILIRTVGILLGFGFPSIMRRKPEIAFVQDHKILVQEVGKQQALYSLWHLFHQSSVFIIRYGVAPVSLPSMLKVAFDILYKFFWKRLLEIKFLKSPKE